MEFHPEDSTVLYSDGKTRPYTLGAQDPLSVVYYARTQPLAVGDTLRVPYHPSKKSVELLIAVLGIDTLETPLGRIPCLVVQPEAEGENLFKGKGAMKVWYTDDARRVPVKIWTDLPIGSLNGILTSYERPEPPYRETDDTIRERVD
jgi:hypothetical protein